MSISVSDDGGRRHLYSVWHRELRDTIGIHYTVLKPDVTSSADVY